MQSFHSRKKKKFSIGSKVNSPKHWKVNVVNRNVEPTRQTYKCFSVKSGLEFPCGGRHMPPFRNGAECLLVEMSNVCFGCIGSGLHSEKRLSRAWCDMDRR